MPRPERATSKDAARRNGRGGREDEPARYDVLVVGGGPAGLSAALLLGRCRRRVLVIDGGRPRNAASRSMHGFLSRDGTPPRELLRLGREELGRYGVELLDGEVDDARELPASDGLMAFEVRTDDGRRFRSRKLLLATGVRDVLPPIEGAEEFYGRGVHHCPYCDGWEHRDREIVAYGAGRPAVGLALSLKTWSDRVTACTGGERVAPKDRQRLTRHGVALRTEPIARLEGDGQALRRVVFASGAPLECDALFFNTEQVQRSVLPDLLGCEQRGGHQLRTHDKQRTCRPGLFLAGDADGDVQFVIVAAAEGARAAVAINRDLQEEDRGEARPPRRPPKAKAGDAQ